MSFSFRWRELEILTKYQPLLALRPFIGRHISKFYLLLVMSVFLGAIGPVVPWLFGKLIDESFINGSDQLFLIPLALVGVFVFKGCLEYFYEVASADFSLSILADLRSYAFGGLLEKPAWILKDRGVGSWVSSIVFNINQIGALFSRVIVSVLKDGFTIIALLIFLLWMSWSLTLVMLISTPLIALLFRVISKKLFLNNKQLQLANGRVSELAQQSLQAIKEIKIFEGMTTVENEFRSASNDLCSTQMAVARYSALSVPLIQILSAVFIALILILSRDWVIDGSFSTGDFVSYIGALALLPDSLRKLINILPPLEKSLVGTLSFRDLCCSKNTEVKTMKTSSLDFGSKSKLQIHEVWPQNRQGESHRKSIDLDVGVGSVVVIEGPSGAGKSSLLDLLMAFVESDGGGHLSIDSYKLNSSDLIGFRKNIAFVGHDSKLLSGSILDNLKLANPNITRGEANMLMFEVGLQDLLSALPRGLDANIGSLGDRLSGGQVQRLLIARALARDAPILILDEPTSALDAENTNRIFHLIDNLDSKLVILVSHVPYPFTRGVVKIGLFDATEPNI